MYTSFVVIRECDRCESEVPELCDQAEARRGKAGCDQRCGGETPAPRVHDKNVTPAASVTPFYSYNFT